MKVLLINPPYKSDCCAYDVGPYVHSPVPSFGLGYIASFLIKKGIEDVTWFECPIQGLKISDIIRNIINNSYDIIGITSTTHTYPNALKLAESLKEKSPGSLIVMGGVHVSFDYMNTLKNPFVDIVVIGEGEQTFYELSRCILEKKGYERVNGISYCKSGEVHVNPPAKRIENLDNLPFPARHLLPKELLKKSGASIITARGCPFNCIFCSSGKFWERKVRYRSPSNVIQEIKEVIKYSNPEKFEFVDDTFTLNKKRVIKICNLIIKEKINLSWSCNSRVDTIDNEIAQKLKSAGCTEIFFGIESVSQNILDTTKKGINLLQIKKAIKTCKDEGLYVTLSFILGLPGENRDSVKKMIDFIKKTNADEILVNPLVPLIGTELYESPEKYEIKFSKGSWEDYVIFNVDTQEVTRDEIRDLYMDIIGAILLKEKTK